ncbi:hypothetical protein [Engelhardtia mirabilis]|uniref:hypothetical protein n=1 Tax=Engelhardtia mirabilis TaxID=2528011 RepID=UPI0011A53043
MKVLLISLLTSTLSVLIAPEACAFQDCPTTHSAAAAQVTCAGACPNCHLLSFGVLDPVLGVGFADACSCLSGDGTPKCCTLYVIEYQSGVVEYVADGVCRPKVDGDTCDAGACTIVTIEVIDPETGQQFDVIRTASCIEASQGN